MLEEAIDARTLGGLFRRKWIMARSFAHYGGDPQHERGRITAAARASRASLLLGTRPRNILHLGNDHLPLPIVGPQQRNYLYIDCTAKSVQNLSSGRGWRNPKLVEDVESLSRSTMAQMDHIFTISSYAKQALVEQYDVDPQRVTPVATGRGPIVPLSGTKEFAGRSILFVAKRGFSDKGGDLLVDAFRIARRTRPDIELVLAGQEEYQRRFAGFPGVVAHGRVTLENLQSLFLKADLFAMPALYEPWGLVYLEALSCKVPVLGMRRNALPEITKQGRFGFLCDVATPEALAATMLDALSDSGRLREMGERGHEFCLDYYTWERTIERIISVVDAGLSDRVLESSRL